MTDPTPIYVYVGSLSYPVESLNNYEKIEVTIFGGEWESSGTGLTTYYISNRNSLMINQTTIGSSNGGRFTIKAYRNSNNSIDFYIVTNNWSSLAVKSVIITGSNGAQKVVNNTYSATPPSYPEIAVSVNPVMITDSNGNIGFNTFNINGNYKILVNGALKAKEVRVESNWADFVFKKEYKLKSLEQIESYIKEQGRLPDVPADEEVRSQGLKVGETSALLLQKIEELTLYLIQQRKELVKQKAMLRNQQKEIQKLRLECNKRN